MVASIANGTQKTTEAITLELQAAGKPYQKFRTDMIHNLDGSNGLITEHGDVKNPAVTYAFASAVNAT